MKDAFWKAIAVPVGFASPAPVPAPMKNREHPLRSGLGGKAGNTIKVYSGCSNRLYLEEQATVK
jgi:hypothetical protein